MSSRPCRAYTQQFQTHTLRAALNCQPLGNTHEYDDIRHRRNAGGVNGLRYSSVCPTVQETLGRVHIHDDWDRYAHVTDSGILDQIIDENQIGDHGDILRLVKRRFFELVDRHLESSPCSPMAGAVEMLDEVRASGLWQIGLATGGWQCTAMAKLQSARIDVSDVPMSSSDDSKDRQDIMRSCLGKLKDSSAKPVYVGDGPWDLRASIALGWGFVGIGARLEGIHQPWVRDFHDPNWAEAPNKAMQDALGAADF